MQKLCFLTDDAASLRRVTETVIKQIAGKQPATERVAGVAARAVLSVFRTGYARDPKRAIDADDLAEAATACIRATHH